MSAGYECECGAVFEFPSIIDSFTWEEFQGQRVRHEEHILACPECEGWDLEECGICEKCKQDRALDGMDYCFTCLPQDIKDDDAEFIAAMRSQA